MPIYMDQHILPGVKARDVAEAHRRDMLIQEDHACNCITYWIDEKRGNVFCLIEAPTKEAVTEMHGKAHGLVPHKIIEVSDTVVEAFLGRISDPEDAAIADNGLKVFHDPSFRIILVTKIDDPVLIQSELGIEKTTELLKRYNETVREALATFGGSEAEHQGQGFIASFTSAGKAVACALAIQKKLSATEPGIAGSRIGISAGEPVTKNEQLFGDTIELAEQMCTVIKDLQVAVSPAVKELVSKDHFRDEEQNMVTISQQDETLLGLLFNTLEQNWQKDDFNITEYCQALAMSKSQLYRRTIALTGLSPNELLQEFRLRKAKELMKQQQYNISQVAFDSGFTSPSYFTKCFKKKFGMLPNTYLDMLR